jgi:hypothetical protein
MTADVFRFTLSEGTPLDEAELTLQLSLFAVEGLYGSASVRLDASYFVDEPRRIILVDGTNEVGGAVVRVFTNLLLREFGEDSFQVRRVDSCPAPRTEGRAA